LVTKVQITQPKKRIRKHLQNNDYEQARGAEENAKLRNISRLSSQVGHKWNERDPGRSTAEY